jgi:HlyD family secretion protein
MGSNLEIVKQRQDDLTLKAPISGLLTSLNAEIGELKSPGNRLGQIDDLSGFRVNAGVDEHWISRVEEGRRGTFPFAGNDYSLVVEKTYLEVRDGRFEVDLLLDGEEPEGLRRGLTLHIRLELGDLAEATLLPRGGFYSKTGGQWVYVLDKSESFAYKRRIRLGRQNPQVFEVLEGLEVGERVITSSYDSYGDIDKLILK